MRKPPIWWHLFDVTVISQLKQGLNLVRVGRKVSGVPVRALNLRDGEVGDTAFFTNRDPAQLTPEQVAAGPTRPEDVATPPFRITKLKGEGKTPGFFVTDAKGARYLFKLDPTEASELLSGAETVTSKLLYALGYHVPSYEVVWVRPEEVQVDPDVLSHTAEGASRPFAQADLERLLEGRSQEGVFRVAASKILDGEVLGPGSFKRFRDCADVRALRLAYAWVNNIDAKDHNSLLVWDGTRTVGYLIDFGTSLGADAGKAGPKHPCAGWLNIVDLREASLKVLTLGLHDPPCSLESGQPVSPRVGFFTTTFDPDDWKPYAPNLAFEEMNQQDGRWIARRMARLSRAQIEAAVSAGRYSDPSDAAYLVDTLDQRRAAILEEYLDEDEDKEPMKEAAR
ncbi:MAG: hypothetical protein HY599_07140 [Candidatus Omnitrophica bacterium]|nr:hypothetical protein [Candidatus Omnitrophota bacterium]